MSRPSLRGRLKAVAVDYVRLFHSPSTRKDILQSSLPMKPIPIIFLVAVASVVPILSQEERTETAGESARTYIPDSLEFPEFTPPAPPVQKVLPQIRIDSSVTVTKEDSRTLTIQLGEASTAADLPPPPPPVPSPPPRELTTDELADLKWDRQHTLHLGATVYDHKTSQVHWTDPETGKTHQAWCGFDVSLLAGLGGFVHKGESYQFFLMHSCVDTGSLSNASAQDLEIPPISAGQILVSRESPAAATTPLQIIQEVIAAEKERLVVYQSARENYQRAYAEWQKAHPPVPRDETVIFRPHRGSRYLADAPLGQKGEAP